MGSVRLHGSRDQPLGPVVARPGVGADRRFRVHVWPPAAHDRPVVVRRAGVDAFRIRGGDVGRRHADRMGPGPLPRGNEGGAGGIALVVVAMPWAALASYINLTHAIEATLICHALAEHALGRRSRALALLTACLFVKPAMAYIYGLLLVLLIIRDAWGGGIRAFLRNLAPR